LFKDTAMYCPPHFEECRPEVLSQLMAQFPLATVVTHNEHGLQADHIPLLHQPAPGTCGKLIGHVARANPLWQCGPEQELLVVFQGPSSYISPNWYASKADGGRVVPTWNYAVVHAHARLKAHHEPQAILDMLTLLTHRHEATQPHPWQVADAPAEFTNKLLTNIVGIELPISQLQGKWKVSQNQPAVNQHSVIRGLREQGDAAAFLMADLVKTFGA